MIKYGNRRKTAPIYHWTFDLETLIKLLKVYEVEVLVDVLCTRSQISVGKSQGSAIRGQISERHWLWMIIRAYITTWEGTLVPKQLLNRWITSVANLSCI